jgi:hypothetical protein
MKTIQNNKYKQPLSYEVHNGYFIVSFGETIILHEEITDIAKTRYQIEKMLDMRTNEEDFYFGYFEDEIAKEYEDIIYEQEDDGVGDGAFSYKDKREICYSVFGYF